MVEYWSDLVEVVEDGEEVEFSNGFTAVDMPVYNFFNIPMCGCGFDCLPSLTGESHLNKGKFSLKIKQKHAKAYSPLNLILSKMVFTVF